MSNPATNKRMVEVVARVFFVQQFRSIDGEKGLIKLELTNSSHTLSAKLDPALLNGRERLIDGQAYRCQLLREEQALLGDYRIIGISRFDNPQKLFTPLLPLGACVRKEVARAIQALDLSWKNPGLRNFMARVFSNPRFSSEWVMAPQTFDGTNMEPSGLAEEAIYACFQIKANPFLSISQQEIAMAALILSRPGRQWVRGNDSIPVFVPDWLHLAASDMQWLANCYPDIYSKLIGIWRSLDTGSREPDHAGVNGVLHVAIWMALGYSPKSITDLIDL
ncbi:MAG: hypothetical protein ACK5RJ_01035 [Burkholderiales bacterium]